MYINDINEYHRALFKKHREIVEDTPILNRVVSVKEVLEILDISQTSFRRSIEQGHYLEEKGDFRKMGASMVFDLESILNRRYMDHKTYWALKEEYEKEKLNKKLFGEGKTEDITINKVILDKVDTIIELLKKDNKWYG